MNYTFYSCSSLYYKSIILIVILIKIIDLIINLIISYILTFNKEIKKWYINFRQSFYFLLIVFNKYNE